MATRYAVGTGTWNASNTGIWSASSGGSTGASVPTAADDVKFDANTTAITLGATAVCRSFDHTGFVGTYVYTGFNMTIGDASGGAVTLATGAATYTGGGSTWTLASTATNGGAGWPITCNGKTIAAGVTFGGTGGKYQLQDTLTATGGVTASNSSVDFNGKTIDAGSLNANATTVRTLTFGGAAFILRNASGTLWTTNASANLTLSGNPSIQIPSANVGTKTITHNKTGTTITSLTVTGTVCIVALSAANTITTVSIDHGFTLRIPESATTTIGTLNIYGSNDVSTAMPFLQTGVSGTQGTLSLTTGNIRYCRIRDIVLSGAASPLYVAGGIDQGNNSGFTFGTFKPQAVMI